MTISNVPASQKLILASHVARDKITNRKQLKTIAVMLHDWGWSPYNIAEVMPVSFSTILRWVGVIYHPGRFGISSNIAKSLDGLLLVALEYEDQQTVRAQLVNSITRGGTPLKVVARLTEIPIETLREAL